MYKVNVCHILQVFHQRCLPDNHPIFIVGFYNMVNLLNLVVYLWCSRHILGADKFQIMVLTLQHAFQIFRYHTVRYRRTYQRIQSNRPFNSVYIFHLGHHGALIFRIHVFVQHNNVDGTHMEIFFQLIICHIAGQCIRQRLGNVVVNGCMVVSVNCREQKKQE